MNLKEAGGVASDRGIGFQAIGFTIATLVCVAVLDLMPMSEYWWYSSFELAATKLYWALIVPLAALFDWGRKMFESGRAIREAKKAQIRDDGVQEGREEGREQTVQLVKAVLEEYDISLPPEAVEKMFGDARNGKR